MSLRGLMPTRRLVDEAARLTRLQLRTVFVPMSLVMVLVMVALVALQTAYYRGVLTSFEGGEPDLELGCGLMALVVLGFLVLLLFLAQLYLVLSVVAVDVAAGRAVDLRRSWRFSLQLKVIGTWVLTSICVFAAMMVCFFPALYVAPLLCLVVPAMVEEGRFGGAALGRSAELIRFNPRRRFADNGLTRGFLLLLTWYLVSSMLNLPTQMPFQAVKMFLMFRNAATEITDLTTPGMVALDLGSAVFGSLAAVMAALMLSIGTALLFFDARHRREGDDLEGEIEAVERRPDGDGALPEPVR